MEIMEIMEGMASSEMGKMNTSLLVRPILRFFFGDMFY